MMKNSALLRWTNNIKNKSHQTGNKNWLHPAESLQKGHIAYLVKFLGFTTVEQPKGMEVVKEASRKLQFSQQLRKSEGLRISKVELTISVNGVAIHDPKTKFNMHQYPLHRISFCADDKAEKRFFSFIAKEPDSDEHTCYVFVSDKLSEEITLTIGQAFDLAYKRFMETSGKELELRRQVASLQSKLKAAETENCHLREQLQGSVNGDQILLDDSEVGIESESSTDVHLGENFPVPSCPPMTLPPVPPRNTKIDDLLSDSAPESDDSDFNPRAQDANISDNNDVNDIFNNQSIGLNTEPTFMVDDFNPRAEEFFDMESPTLRQQPPLVTPPPLMPPPRPSRPHEVSPNSDLKPAMNSNLDDIFSCNSACDPFSDAKVNSQQNNNNNNKTDDILSQFIEMKAGFSRGLSFGTGDKDFNLDSLDPLKN